MVAVHCCAALFLPKCLQQAGSIAFAWIRCIHKLGAWRWELTFVTGRIILLFTRNDDRENGHAQRPSALVSSTSSLCHSNQQHVTEVLIVPKSFIALQKSEWGLQNHSSLMTMQCTLDQ